MDDLEQRVTQLVRQGYVQAYEFCRRGVLGALDDAVRLEREQCAQLADQHGQPFLGAAIRARGKQ